MRSLWRNYSLSIILGCLFLAAWTAQTWAGWYKFAAEQASHGESAQWFGPSGYVWEWTAATMENWQSEFLQLFTFVVLTAYFIHRGSHESKDSDEEQMAMLQRIEKRLESIEAGVRAQRV
jgi:hypothetical protein